MAPAEDAEAFLRSGSMRARFLRGGYLADLLIQLENGLIVRWLDSKRCFYDEG